MIKPRKVLKDAKPRSDAQHAATERNFHIFRLRGFHAQALLLSPSRRAQVEALIDDEIVSLGAESQADRAAARMASREAAEADQRIRDEIEEQELPF